MALPMYRCALCEGVVPPKTPCLRKVTLSRPVRYPERPDVNRRIVKGRIRWSDDPGGFGVETVREVLVCKPCHEERAPARAERRVF